MAKYTPSGNVRNRADLNAELTRVAAAINDQLDKLGGSGNQMQADLDMNSNSILNTRTQTGSPTSLTNVEYVLNQVAGTLAAARSYTDAQIAALNGGGVTPPPPEADWFNIEDYGAVANNITDNTSAINAAIAALETAGGGVLYIPPKGVYRTTGSHPVPSNMTVYGGGWESCLKLLASASPTPVFLDIPTVRPSLTSGNVVFEGVRLEGIRDENGGREVGSNGIITMVGFENVTIRNCFFRNSTAFGMNINQCHELKFLNNFVEYINRDAVGIWNTPQVHIIGNYIHGNDDDGISLNTENTATPSDVVKHNHVITNNILIDTGGIRFQSGKNAVIANNILQRCKGIRAIYTSGSNTSGFRTANNNTLLIEGNIVLDIVDRSLSTDGQLAPSSNFRAAMHIESIPVSGTLGPYDGFYTSTGPDGTGAARATENIVIRNNIVKRTLPAVANYSDWGMGRILSRFTDGSGDGFLDPQVEDFHLQARFLEVERACHQLLIEGNVFDHSGQEFFHIKANAQYTYSDMDFQQVRIERNFLRDLNTVMDKDAINNTVQDITFKGNFIDGDPLSRQVGHADDGTWAGALNQIGIDVSSLGGIKVVENTFRNVSLPYRVGANPERNVLHSNFFAGEPAEGTSTDVFNVANRGIGQYPREVRSRPESLIYENSNPESSDYGELISSTESFAVGTTPPANGYYFSGQTVLSASALITSGEVVLGFRRIASGVADGTTAGWTTLTVSATAGNGGNGGSGTWAADGSSLDLSPQTTTCRGIAEIGNFLHVLSNAGTSVYIYRLSDRQYDDRMETLSGPTFVQDVMADPSDATRWVSTDGNLVRQYNTAWNATGTTLTSPVPQGFARESGFFWTIDSNGTVRQFNDATRAATGVTYTVGFTNIQGLASSNDRLYFVTNTGEVHSVNALDGADSRVEIRTGLAATGIWTDGTNMWVSTATSAQRYTSS